MSGAPGGAGGDAVAVEVAAGVGGDFQCADCGDDLCLVDEQAAVGGDLGVDDDGDGQQAGLAVVGACAEESGVGGVGGLELAQGCPRTWRRY